MKKLCAIVAILGIATFAQAASLDMMWGASSTGAVSADGNTIDLAPGQTGILEFWLNYDNGVSGARIGLNTTGAGFTFDDVVAGPAVYGDLDEWQPEDVGFDLDAWEANMLVYPYLYGAGDTMLVSVVITGTADTGSIDISYDQLSGTANVTAKEATGGTPFYSIDFSETVGVNFVPEPASLALVALGGLALIRRR